MHKRLSAALLASTALALQSASAASLLTTRSDSTAAAQGTSGIGLYYFGGVVGLGMFDGVAAKPGAVPIAPIELPAFGGDETCAANQAGVTSVVCAVNLVRGAPPAALSILSYGAVAGTNTAAAATANTTAFANAAAAGNDLYCPSAQTFYVNPIVLPSSLQSLTGACKLLPGPSFTDGNPIVKATGNANLYVNGLEADAPLASFRSTTGFSFVSQSNLTAANLRSTSAYGITDNSSTHTTLLNDYVGDYLVNGIIAQNDTDVKILAPTVLTTGNGASHCVSVSSSTNAKVSEGFVSGCGHFGYSFSGTPQTPELYPVLTNSKAVNTIHEAANFTDVTGFTETGNNFQFNSASTVDFGTSIAAGDTQTVSSTTYTGVVAQGLIAGNTIVGPAKACVALANNITGVSVHGNSLTYCGQSIGTSGADTAHSNAAILLYGTGTNLNSIGINSVNDPASHLTYQVAELNDGGTPNGNQFLPQIGSFASSVGLNILGSLSLQANLTPWTPYTPTVSCGSGSLSSATATGNYQKIGKTLTVNLDVKIASSGLGTCAGGLFASIPYASAANAILPGREGAVTGKFVQAPVGPSSSSLQFLYSDNSNPAANSVQIDVSGSLQTTQ